MMIDNISSSSSGVKTPTGTQPSRHTSEPKVQSPIMATDAMDHMEPSAEAVKAAVKEMNEFVRPAGASIQFSLDEESGRTIVKMVDTDTNKVVRQFPSEEALAISRALDRLKGLTVHVKA